MLVLVVGAYSFANENTLNFSDGGFDFEVKLNIQKNKRSINNEISSITIKKSGNFIEPMADVSYTLSNNEIKISFTSYSQQVNAGKESFSVDFSENTESQVGFKSSSLKIKSVKKFNVGDKDQYVVELNPIGNSLIYPTGARLSLDGNTVQAEVLTVFKKDKNIKYSALVFYLPRNEFRNNEIGSITILESAQLVKEKVNVSVPLKK